MHPSNSRSFWERALRMPFHNINAKVNVSFQRSKITAYTGKVKGRCLRFG